MSVPRFRTSPFYNGVGSFKSAFPVLHDAVIEWEELTGPDDKPKGRNLRKMGHKRGNFSRGLISCGSDDCREGGYQIDRLIEEMLLLGETQRKGTLYCSGREVAEDGRRSPVRCRRRIQYRVTLTPKQGKGINAA